MSTVDDGADAPAAPDDTRRVLGENGVAAAAALDAQMQALTPGRPESLKAGALSSAEVRRRR